MSIDVILTSIVDILLNVFLAIAVDNLGDAEEADEEAEKEAAAAAAAAAAEAAAENQGEKNVDVNIQCFY